MRQIAAWPRVVLAAATALGVACAADSELALAVNTGNVEAARRLLLAGHDPNAHLTEGWTPLVVAASAKDLAMVELLVTHGGDVAQPKDAWLNRDGGTPLHYAARNGAEEVVAFLLSKGAPIQVTDAEDVRPCTGRRRAETRTSCERSSRGAPTPTRSTSSG